MSKITVAKFNIGEAVSHRMASFRGVVFDIDPEFKNSEEWYQSIPADLRPRKDQPFYHVLAENSETQYIAYVSEQSLVPDISKESVRHPQIDLMFEMDDAGDYSWPSSKIN